MLSDKIHQALNTLMHKLNSEAYMFSGVAAYFRKAGHFGLAAFASAECRERWGYADDVKDCIDKFGLDLAYPALPAAPTTYQTPVVALQGMLTADQGIVFFLQSAMKETATVGDWVVICDMNHLFDKLLKEHNEIKHVLEKITAVGNDMGALLQVNESLYEEYKDKLDCDH